MKKLCIYHSHCADGFGAACAVRQALGDNVEFYPGLYTAPPPDVTGRDVIFVDFCYKRPVMEEVARKAASVLILDHHKSAMEDMIGLQNKYANVTEHFDMARSGAGIAWDYFHPGKNRPEVINHIEDRDLWRFWLHGTREIQSCLFSYPYDFALWDNFFDDEVCENMIIEGAAIDRKHLKDINEMIGAGGGPQWMTLGGLYVPVLNVPYTMGSDAANILCKGIEFAGYYWDSKDGRNFGLRSEEGGKRSIDVANIAKLYGGGGHAHASGFRMPLGWHGDVSSPKLAESVA